MAYQTGSAESRDDLVDKLRGFLAASGWTTDFFGLVNEYGSFVGARLHMHKNGMYVNIRSNTFGERVIGNTNITGHSINGICLYLSTGYDASAPSWWQMPGSIPVSDASDVIGQYYTAASAAVINSDWLRSATSTPVYSYYFFDNGRSVSIILELNPGEYQSLHFGWLEPLVNSAVTTQLWFYTGWATTFSSGSTAANRCPAFGQVSATGPSFRPTYLRIGSKWWLPQTSGSSHGFLTPIDINAGLYYNSNIPEGNTPLFPIIFMAGEEPALCGQVGNVNDIGMIYHSEAYNPGHLITYGDDTWALFPNYTAGYGLAIRKTQ